jgi:hypothetical protein
MASLVFCRLERDTAHAGIGGIFFLARWDAKETENRWASIFRTTGRAEVTVRTAGPVQEYLGWHHMGYMTRWAR